MSAEPHQRRYSFISCICYMKTALERESHTFEHAPFEVLTLEMEAAGL